MMPTIKIEPSSSFLRTAIQIKPEDKKTPIEIERKVQRQDIDHSVLASLITLSQTMGQIQGEIAILKASGIDLKPIEKQLDSLNKIVINGDINNESLISQIKNLNFKVTDIKGNLDRISTNKEMLEFERLKIKSETKRINLDNFWKIVLAVIGIGGTVIGAWFNLK